VGFIPAVAKQMDEGWIRRIATVFLGLFLGMAMAYLRLWELETMALPLAVILLSQVVLMVVFAVFVAYPALGRNYESVVLVSGLCGFGLGATPNALANMEAVCSKYRTIIRPFLIVPIIGAMFLDIINISVISVLLNIIR
jgi:ESS family glutamate:Na+ symporter